MAIKTKTKATSDIEQLTRKVLSIREQVVPNVKLLSVKQVMEVLGFARLETVYKYIHSGVLKAIKLGGDGKKNQWRIKREDFEEFLNSKEYKDIKKREIDG